MILSLRIKNFRCFEDLSTSPKAVNVVVGLNGTGKTALLEAITLGLRANPGAAAVFNQSRSLTETASTFPTDPTSVQSYVWNSLFKDTEKTIEIDYTCSNDDYKLSLLYENPPKVPSPMAENVGHAAANSPSATKSICMKRKKGSEEECSYISPTFQIPFPSGRPDLGPSVWYFGATYSPSVSDNVKWFSELRIKGKGGDVVEAIKRQFPMVQDIEVLSQIGPSLWATLASGEKRPIGLVSAGIHRVISLLLGCASMQNGVVVIDEIENGVFHGVYKAMWEEIIRICRTNKNQLFISTHSLECLRELAPAMEGHEDDFCLLRSSINQDHKVVLKEINGTAMYAALSGAIEVR